MGEVDWAFPGPLVNCENYMAMTASACADGGQVVIDAGKTVVARI